MISSKNNLSTSNPSSYKETWFIVPSYILDLPNITLGFLRVYEAFFQFHNKGLPCFLSNKALSERAGIELRQVQNALEYFEKHNEIIRIQKGNRRYLTKPMVLVETNSINNIHVTDNCSAMHSSAPPPCTPVHPEYKEVEKTTTPKLPSVASSSTSSNQTITPVEFIQVFAEEFPNNDLPVSHAANPKKIEKRAVDTIKLFKSHWKADSPDIELTKQAFRNYLIALKKRAPGFSGAKNEQGRGRWNFNVICSWENHAKFMKGKVY